MECRSEAWPTPDGSWTTSSTNPPTAWTPSAVPLLRPQREASGRTGAWQELLKDRWMSRLKVHEQYRSVKQWILCRYWGGLVPEGCRQAHLGEEWNCLFGYKVYPTLKSKRQQEFACTVKTQMVCHLIVWPVGHPLSRSGPVFVVQWLFDEVQLTVSNIHLTGQPVHEGQWRYIQNLGQELRSTLQDVP